jgi:hypothetical protein
MLSRLSMHRTGRPIQEFAVDFIKLTDHHIVHEYGGSPAEHGAALRSLTCCCVCYPAYGEHMR